MAVQEVPSVDNIFTGTNEDEFANSTSENETFTMGGGNNTINFDISNNSVLGIDEIHLTPGEDLVLNFTGHISLSSFVNYSPLIGWERIVNDHDGIDLVVKTYACSTYGYAKVVDTITDEIDYQTSSYIYYKGSRDYYLYDYENNEWVLNYTIEHSAQRNQTSYGRCYVNSKTGLIDSPIGYYNANDLHEDYAEIDGTISGQIESENIVNTITIKDIGAENTANSVKLQYTNPDNSVKTYQEYINGNYQDVNFITKLYTLGSKDSTENQVLQGSFLDETFWTSKGNDTISTVGGNNTIYLYNSGKDVTLGEGADYVNGDFSSWNLDWQSKPDYPSLGTNSIPDGIIIKEAKGEDTLKLNNYTTSGYYGDYSFYRNTNDLIIIENYQYNASSRTSRFTIEDYFTEESKIVIKAGNTDTNPMEFVLNNEQTQFTLTTQQYNSSPQVKDYTISNNIIIQDENSSEIAGTDNSEVIIATKQANITTGNGNDIVYTSQANDNITVNGTGDKTIYTDFNSGEDIIDVENLTGNVYLKLLNTDKVYDSNMEYKLYKDKESNNLVIERHSRTTDASFCPDVTNAVIIKNYFNLTQEQKNKIYLVNENRNKMLNIGKVYIEGDEGENNTIQGTNYNDIITGKELVDTIYTGEGNDDITPNTGNDIINVNGTGNKTINLAQGDGKDTIILTNTALTDESIKLNYTDGLTGISKGTDSDGNLKAYKTLVDGDTITTEDIVIKDGTGTDINLAGKVSFYDKGVHYTTLANNTPIYQELSKTENNTYAANEVSNLVTGGSGVDNITAEGQINHVYTGAGDDKINVTSSVFTMIHSGSGTDEITVNGTGTAESYIYSENGNDTINVQSGETYVDAGDGDDTINVSGGYADIKLGKGADIVNITGGNGGTIHFKQGDGNKTVNFDGASEAQYDIMISGSYWYNYKDGNNLRIDAKEYNNTTGEYDLVDTYYVNNYFSSADSKINPDTSKIGGSYSTLHSREMNIIGTPDATTGGKTFEGTYCRDIIEGTDYADTITTGTEHDRITAGKGDDIITVNGDGEKIFYYTKGDGNDTINIDQSVVFTGKYNDYTPGIHLYNDYSYDNNYEKPSHYSYSLEGSNLTLYRTYNNDGNPLVESTTITGIRALDTDNPAKITAENIASSSGGLNVSHKIYVQNNWTPFSADMAQMNKGKDNEENNLTTTEDTYNTLIGGNKADTVNSNGLEDYIATGAGNDNIITSAITSTVYAGSGDDTITANNGETTHNTTTIYGGEGNDTITSNVSNATIYGDAGDDTIVVTKGTNNIYLGTGSDTVKISGGQGTINLLQGTGSNTLIFESNNEDGTCHLDGIYNIALGNNYGLGYSKSGDDLVILRSSTTNDTLTVKGLFGANQISDGSNFRINGSTLSSMTVSGNYDKKQKATVFSGSNYNDRINATKGKDIITTGGGNDTITSGKGNDIIIIDGSGNKTINFEKGGGNDVIKLGEGVTLGNINLYNYDGKSYVSSYKIQNNDFIIYRTYVDGDKFTTENTRITGIAGGEVTYDNIMGNGEYTQLNITNKLVSRPTALLNDGNFKKANKISTKEGINNTVFGGKKNDVITLNGVEDRTHTGAGADNITVKGKNGSDTIYAGSGNDIITLNDENKSVDIYGQGGNDKIYANGTGRYNFHTSKGDGNDTIILGKDFNQKMYFYNYGASTTQMSHKIVGDSLILYRTYVDGDNIKTESSTIKGIKSTSETPSEITFQNIQNSGGGLNISGSYISDYNKTLIQGNAKKANKITTTVGDRNTVITGGKKNDTVTLNGSDYAYTGKGNDTVIVNSTGSARVEAGSGNDTITVKKGSVNIYSGKGKDKINISGGSGYIYLKAGEGNDTITFSGNEFGNYSLSLSGYSSNYNPDYYKSGNDLLIKCTYKNAKKKDVVETHTIKNYFGNETIQSKLSLPKSMNNINIVGKYDKKQKATIFEGTKYTDTFTGTKKKDIITTGDGSDKITAGKGDDTIIIDGDQVNVKYIYINNGDGNDTVKWAENGKGIAYIITNSTDILNLEKSDRNLILTRYYQSGNSVKSEKTIIENCYDEDGNPETYTVNENTYSKVYINGAKLADIMSFNRKDYNTSTINVTTDSELAVGTKKADTVTLNAANSAVYTLAGNDTINVNSGNAYITGGTGSDTININTTGTVIINHAAGDGNDIINFGENTPSTLKINLESPFLDNYNSKVSSYMYMSGKHGIHKSGDDLIYSIPTSSKINAKTETITFKDYFKEGVNKPEYIRLSLSEDDNYYNMGSIESFKYTGIWVDGVTKDGVTTYTGLSDFNNRYEYKGKGKAVINGGSKADYYNISISKNSNLYINDVGETSGWGDDTMYINTDYKNLRVLFNVNADGKIALTDNDLSDNFMIFEKGSYTASNIKNILGGKDGKGVININNVFTDPATNYPNGDGAITYIYAGKNLLKECYKNGSNFDYSNSKDVQKLHLSYWTEDLGSKVASWLATYSNGKYADKSAFDVLESDNTKDINALLKVYNVAYDKNFSS